MYSIGQVAEMFGLPISTLRYYDKQGLFPNMERVCQISSFAGLTAAFLVFIVLSYLRGVPQSFSRSSRPWGSARSKSSHISCVHTAVPAAAVRSTLVRC